MDPRSLCVKPGQVGWGGIVGLPGGSAVESSDRGVRSPDQGTRVVLRFLTRGVSAVTVHSQLKQPDSTGKAKVIVIAGPTAVGKTSLALALAKSLGGEIVSADSVQVYKGLDIGSAKTPVEKRDGITHHLVDIISPTEQYGAGMFYDNAREATAKVLEKGLVPIVVGGTGMYLRWYIYGKPGTPRSSQQQVATVDAKLAEIKRDGGGWDEAVKLLADLGDPTTAGSLTRNDWYRLRRSLEIVIATGQPREHFVTANSDTSAVAEESNPGKHNPLNCDAQELDYDFRCYFLYKPRMELFRQIDLRCEHMVQAGLLQEASALLDLGIEPNSSPPSRAIGYRQAMEFLSACRTKGGVSTEEEAYAFLATFQKASRNFVRRQLTWFRSEPLFRWVNASQPLEAISRLVAADYSASSAVADIGSPVKGESYKEGHALKHFKAKLELFNNPEAFATLVDWVNKTQKGSANPRPS